MVKFTISSYYIVCYDCINAHVAPRPPLVPTVRNIITAPRLVNISWEVLSIICDNEIYSVQYGTNKTMLVNTSEVVNGSTDGLAISNIFLLTSLD